MQCRAQDFVTLGSMPGDSTATRDAELSALAAESLRQSGRLRLQVRGESMLPSLWPGDRVEIAGCSVDDVRPGEIVLALREGRFFLHRFLAATGQGGFVLRGDSMPAPDPQFPNQALLGRLVNCAGPNQSQSEGLDLVLARPALPLRPWSWTIGKLLCHCGPVRRLALRLHGCRKPQIPNLERTGDARAIALEVVEDSRAS